MANDATGQYNADETEFQLDQCLQSSLVVLIWKLVDHSWFCLLSFVCHSAQYQSQMGTAKFTLPRISYALLTRHSYNRFPLCLQRLKWAQVILLTHRRVCLETIGLQQNVVHFTKFWGVESEVALIAITQPVYTTQSASVRISSSSGCSPLSWRRITASSGMKMLAMNSTARPFATCLGLFAHF